MNTNRLPNKYISNVKQPNIIAKPSQSHTCIQLSLPAQALTPTGAASHITFSLDHNVSLLLSQKNSVLISEKHLREHPSIPIFYNLLYLFISFLN